MEQINHIVEILHVLLLRFVRLIAFDYLLCVLCNAMLRIVSGRGIWQQSDPFEDFLCLNMLSNFVVEDRAQCLNLVEGVDFLEVFALREHGWREISETLTVFEIVKLLARFLVLLQIRKVVDDCHPELVL